MTSAHTTKLTFTILRTTILMAVVAALLFATPHGALAAAPERPTDLTAAATHHDTVSLTWSHPDPATVDHYQVLSRRVDSGTGLAQVGTSTTTSFEHDGLEPESTYFYRVKPVNSAGEEGQRSARAEATTPAPPQQSDERGQGNIARSSHNVLVSNIGQANNASSLGVSSFDQAQGFTTGADSAGYTLASVDIKIENSIHSILTGSNIPTVTIVEATPTGTVEATLINPASITANTTDDYTFTAPASTTLSGSTTYYVVMEGGLAGFEAARTNSDNEDSSSQSDWRIDNVSNWRNSSSNGSFSTTTSALMIKVNRAGTTLSSDATLRDLELEGAGGETITLSPEFAQGTTTYTASVANRIDTVTLSATKNDANATVVITSDDDNATPGEAELDLSVGANTLTTTVTAEDASALTYTITATRATAPPVPTDCPTDTDWCTTMTVGYNTLTTSGVDIEYWGYEQDQNNGDLRSTTFSHSVTSYSIADVYREKVTTGSDTTSDDIVLNANPALPHGTILQLGSRTFTVNAGSDPTLNGIEAWDIEANPLSWTDGQHVTVSLKLPSNDATLSTLVLQDASDDSVLTLDPTFDAATLEYGATVGRSVGEITIIPTPNDTDADHEVQDGDGAALTDADTTQDEFQVSIARGLNTIQVEVTAEDATTQTYTVTVTRPRILVSSTGQTSGGSAETGKHNGNQTKHAQKFTTGSNPAGYTLDEVKIHLGTNGNAAAPVITVNSGSGNNPGAFLYTMTNPATITDETTNTFTAPSGATLEADTSYFVVMENSNTNDDPNALYQVGITASNGEDSTGLSDWDIDDTGRTGTPGWSGTSGNVAFRIQVRGTVDVDPDAAALPELSFQSINITVDEDGSQAALAVELSQASADTVTVDYATSDNTAEAGDDYTETSGTLTFAPGETVKAIIVPILDDAIYERLERFNVTLSNPTGATLPPFPGAAINIRDDESPPTATIADVTVGEDAGTMTLTLNLSHESSRRTEYETTTSRVGGTATQGADYENFLSGGEARITVPAGDTQASLDITITDDAAAESSETITIRWDNDPTGGKGDATPSVINFTGTITDNDGETNPVTTLVSNASETSSGSENGGHAQSFRTGTNPDGYTITEVQIHLGTHQLTTHVAIAKIHENNSGEPGNDIATLTKSTTLLADSLNTFTAPAGTTLEPSTTYWVVVNDGVQNSTTWRLALTPANDETGETGWDIGNNRLWKASGTTWNTSTESLIMVVKGTSITNLSIIDASATEGDDIVFTVNLSGTSADDVTFDYATRRQSDDNSEAIDFTTTTGTGTITAGSTYTTITVPTFDDGTNLPDSTYEGDETFTITISNPTLAGISQATAKGTILDDESLPTVKFIANNRVTAEHTGSITDFTLFSIVPKGEQTSQISLTLAGTATRNDDYVITSTTLTVSANQSQLGTPITLVNDNVAEVTETVIITVVAASANIQVDPEFSTRTLTITDDDEHPTLSFTSETYNVNENAGHAVLTVNKTGLSDFPVHVDYETVSRNLAIAGDDYVATSGTLTFQPAEFSKTFSVPIIDNNTYKDFGQRFNVDLKFSPQSSDENLPVLDLRSAVVTIINDDPVPTASMANVTANERAGTMTLTLKLSHPSTQDISYRTPDNSEYRGGTATFEDDYEIQYDVTNNATITVPAGQLTKSFDITLIDDDLEEPDETVELVWLKVSSSQATPDEFTFTGTITDPPICDALGNLENTVIVMNLTGEITQPGQSKFHNIKLDPYRSYMIEAIGRNGEDMLGVEEHPNLTLSNPDIPAIWNARATSRWITYGGRNDGDQPKNVIRRFLDSSYRTYKVEVNSGTGETGTYQLKIRVNNICRLDENENAHYQWAGGPKGYPQGSDLPAGIGGRQVLLTGTDWGNDNITRPEMHHVLGDNWNSNRDEDWIGVDLEAGAEYTARLRTKNSLPERLQATGLKILGMKDESGNAIAGSASTGSAGTTVFLTNFEAPSTGRFHIAVGSQGSDRTGTYWLSIYKQLPD